MLDRFSFNLEISSLFFFILIFFALPIRIHFHFWITHLTDTHLPSIHLWWLFVCFYFITITLIFLIKIRNRFFRSFFSSVRSCRFQKPWTLCTPKSNIIVFITFLNHNAHTISIDVIWLAGFFLDRSCFFKEKQSLSIIFVKDFFFRFHSTTIAPLQLKKSSYFWQSSNNNNEKNSNKFVKFVDYLCSHKESERVM